jgi:hypothetical protein
VCFYGFLPIAGVSNKIYMSADSETKITVSREHLERIAEHVREVKADIKSSNVTHETLDRLGAIQVFLMSWGVEDDRLFLKEGLEWLASSACKLNIEWAQ